MSIGQVRRAASAFALLSLAQIPVVAASAAEPADRAPDEVRALAAAYDASGHDLFVRFGASPGNIVFSPYSVGTAMAMVLSGARGATATEMARVLRQTQPAGAIDAANKSLLATLNGYDRSAQPVACPNATMHFNGKDCEAALPSGGACASGYRDGERCIAPARRPASAALKAANALMLLRQNGDMIAPAYAGRLEESYRAQVFRGAGLDEINRWVDRATEGKIEKILDQIDPTAPAVILNAIYFKTTWQSPFGRNATRDADFRLSPTARVKVPTMHRMGHYQVITRPGFRAIRLPYSVDALAMVIVLPNEVDGATRLARELDAPKLAALFRDMTESKNVELALPRFKTSFRASLGNLFMQAGMKRAFDPKLADFSGMTGQPPAAAQLAISDVIHRAVIEVNEEGTEAAAATAVAMMAASMPPKSEPFVIDRPFLFYITDQASGAILFQGRISDPRPPPS
jgi:serpin B